MKALLDTNILSEIRKPRPNAAVLAWFDAQEADDLYVSVLTLGEIREGVDRLAARDEARARTLRRWLADLSVLYADRILPVDLAVAEDWGRLRASAARTLPVIDAFLAATARVHGLTLVTRNEKDFRGIDVPVFNPS
ncbi:MAG TPA: type II toxin-antitoxin system VapC family toxin [Vicinamibacterales bacterium]|nr:type II toxin-antitoxin system VapC family toxin [Vicinamibacterales bacterium]